MKKEKFDSFLSGKLIDLIILDQKIVKSTDWYKWLNFKKNTDYLEVGKFPNTLKDQIFYLKNHIHLKKEIISSNRLSKKLQLGIVEKKSNTLIGMVVAYNFNYFNRTCSVSSIIDYRKRLNNKIRLFKESQDLIIEHVFFKMNFRKICTGTSSEKLSLLSEKLWGFKREGTLKKHAFINGEYVDNFILGLFREDWKIFKKKLN